MGTVTPTLDKVSGPGGYMQYPAGCPAGRPGFPDISAIPGRDDRRQFPCSKIAFQVTRRYRLKYEVAGWASATCLPAVMPRVSGKKRAVRAARMASPITLPSPPLISSSGRTRSWRTRRPGPGKSGVVHQALPLYILNLPEEGRLVWSIMPGQDPAPGIRVGATPRSVHCVFRRESIRSIH